MEVIKKRFKCELWSWKLNRKFIKGTQQILWTCRKNNQQTWRYTDKLYKLKNRKIIFKNDQRLRKMWHTIESINMHTVGLLEERQRKTIKNPNE